MLNQQVPLDRVFHALADSSRLGMVERLSRGPASVSELARPLEMSLAAVVQHIKVLEGSGLVRSEKVGRVRACRSASKTLRTGSATGPARDLAGAQLPTTRPGEANHLTKHGPAPPQTTRRLPESEVRKWQKTSC